MSKSSTITRDHLARLIKKETGLGVAKGAEIVDDFFDIIANFIIADEPVKLRKFGTFSIKIKKPRLARNPKTLEEVMIPERKVVRFKIAPSFKQKLNMNMQHFKDYIFDPHAKTTANGDSI